MSEMTNYAPTHVHRHGNTFNRLYPFVFDNESEAKRWAQDYVDRHRQSGSGGAMPTNEPVRLPLEHSVPLSKVNTDEALQDLAERIATLSATSFRDLLDHIASKPEGMAVLSRLHETSYFVMNYPAGADDAGEAA